jgi:hypothetical protein
MFIYCRFKLSDDYLDLHFKYAGYRSLSGYSRRVLVGAVSTHMSEQLQRTTCHVKMGTEATLKNSHTLNIPQAMDNT